MSKLATVPVLTTRPQPTGKAAKALYLNPNNDLSAKEQSYCRCVLHVGAKNPEECNRPGQWGRGTDCYNPYAICAKSVGTTSRRCGENYNFSATSTIPDNELAGYAVVHGKPVPSPYDRKKMLATLQSWQGSK